MLLITFTNRDGVYRERQFHIGDKLPDLNNCEIESVLADGHELTAISRQIQGIPLANKRHVLWCDPWATFIVDNLDLKGS